MVDYADSSLIAWYRCEGATGVNLSGSQIYDERKTYHGTGYGSDIAYVSGGAKRDGTKALNFGGTDDYVQMSSPIINNTNTLTISFWMKTNNGASSGVSGRSFLGNRGENTEGAYFDWSTIPRFVIEGTARDFTTNMIDNTWHLLTGVYNGTNIIVYEDGVISTSVAKTGIINTSNNFAIGRDTRSLAYYFNGSIDDVRIYNRVLNQAEILKIMHGKGGVIV